MSHCTHTLATLVVCAFFPIAGIILMCFIPDWKEIPQEPEPKNKDPDFIKNLVSLWVAQNNVVWGRLTVIAALQTGVFAGWFTTFDRERFLLATLVTCAGWALSWAAYALIDCDLKWKSHFTNRLKGADHRLLPADANGVQGWKIIRRTVQGFYWSNVCLSTLSIFRLLNPHN